MMHKPNRVTTRQLKAMHSMWRKVAPALSNDRAARLDYASAVIEEEINTFSELTRDEAARIISTMKRELRRPRHDQRITSFARRSRRPAASHKQPCSDPCDRNGEAAGGEIFHSATDRQQWMIKRLAGYLEWSDAQLDAFLRQRFRCKALWSLKPKQAWAAIRVLLNIAARRDIKLRLGHGHKVSKAEIDAEIPAIKKRLK